MPINQRISFKSKKRGALLLEVLLAIMILSVSVTVIIQALTANLRALAFNSGYMNAAFLAENKLFELIYAPSGQLSSGPLKKFADPFSQYSYTVDIKKHEESENLKEAGLKIEWNSGWKKNSLALDTYLRAPK